MNELKHLDEFQQALQNYQLSEAARQLLSRTNLALLVGPSSSGRNSIINELLKSGDYHYIVSDTTRQPRVNNGVPEQNGREYWFRQETELLSDIKAGQFLEAAIIHNQQVSGISIRELTTAADEHKVAINEVEVVGADNIHQAKPDAVFIFVVPPSFDEWIVRMNGRGELPADEIKRRLNSAITEISVALKRSYYRFVVNDTFTHTAHRINDMIMNGTRDDTAESSAKLVAEQILADTRTFLSNVS